MAWNYSNFDVRLLKINIHPSSQMKKRRLHVLYNIHKQYNVIHTWMFNIFICLITKKYTKFKLLTTPKKKKKMIFLQLLQKH